MDSGDLYLVEAEFHNGSTVVTRYYATHEYQTGPLSTNLVRQSDKMNTTPWNPGTGITVTENAGEAPDGSNAANLIQNAGTTPSQSDNQSVTFTGDGVKCASVYLKADTAPTTTIILRDNTAGVNRGRVTVAWSGSVPTITDHTGSDDFPLLPVPNRPGWFRFRLNGQGYIAANSNSLNIYPTGTGQVAGNVYAWRAQAEDRSAPTDSIQTTTVAVARTNPNTIYRARLDESINVGRYAFDTDKTRGRSKTATGSIPLLNGDGALDELAGFAADGRAVRVLHARATPRPEYPLGFTTVFVGTQDAPDFPTARAMLKPKDEQRALASAFQSTKYDGDNVPPDGLEGTEDLKGKPKPILYGVKRNVRPVLVNPAKLIYQFTDGAAQSLEGLFDRGVRLGESFDATELNNSSLAFGGNAVRAVAVTLDSSNQPQQIVAVGDAGDLARSTSGTSWANISPNDLGGNDMFAVKGGRAIAGQARIIIAGEAGTLYTYDTDDLSSGNGTSRTSNFAGNAIRGLDYIENDDVWVAVGDGGKISTSTDGGDTWTARTSGVATALLGVCHRNGTVIAFGASGVILWSDDNGATWNTVATSGFGASAINAGCFNGERFVLVGADNKRGFAIKGTDDWQLGNAPGSSAIVLRGVTWREGRFVAVGDEEAVSTSADGSLWYARGHTSGSSIDYLAITAYLDRTHIGGFDGTDGQTYRASGPGTYGSLANLEDDSLAPRLGSYKTYLAGGYFRLGSIPEGLVTADASEGANAAARTAGQVFVRALQRAGYTTGDWNAADITALDSADNSVIGFWTDEETTFAAVLDQIAGTAGAAWFIDKSGVIRIKQLVLPSGDAVLSLTTADDLGLEMVRTDDDDRGVPPWRIILRYAHNPAVQTTDVAAGVTSERRALIGKEWLTVEASDAAIKTVHPLAGELTIDTLYQDEVDAQAEADRLLTLRGTQRRYFRETIAYDEAARAVDLFEVVQLTHDRYGLNAGKKFYVLGLNPRTKDGRLTLSLWGDVAA